MKFIVGLILLFSINSTAQTNMFPDDAAFTSCFNTKRDNVLAGLATYPDELPYKNATWYVTKPTFVDHSIYGYNTYTIEIGYQLAPPAGAPKENYRMYEGFCSVDIWLNSDQRQFASTNTSPADRRENNATNSCGSVINFNKRTVVESIPIEGTNLSINYSSEFNSNIDSSRTISNQYKFFQNKRPYYNIDYVNVASASVISGVSFTLITDAYNSDFEVPSNAFTGNSFITSATINTILTSVVLEDSLCTSYYTVSGTDYIYDPQCESPFTFNEELENVVKNVTLYHPQVWGAHGWTVSEHHFFDRYSKKLFKGTGEIVEYVGYKTETDVTLGTVYALISKDDDTEMFLFDSDGRHLETRHTLFGYVIKKFTYDGNNRLTSIVDRFNKSTTLTYSGSNLQKITSPYGVETYFTITSNRITKATDAENFEYDMTYDSGTGLLLTYEPPNGVVTTFSYNADGAFLQESKSNGLLQSFVKTIVDGIIKLTKSLNFGVDRTVQIEMDQYGQKTNQVNANNDLIFQIEKMFSENKTKFKFYQDMVTEQFSPSSEWGSDRVVVTQKNIDITESGQNVAESHSFYETRTFDSSNILEPVNYSDSLTISQGYGGYLSNAYTKSNLTFASTDLYGVTTTTEYSASGMVSRISRPDTYPVDFEYDSAGRLIKVEKASSYYETYGYDTYGYLSTIGNSKSQLTQFIRNKKGQLLQKILPNSESIYIEYTDGGEVKKITAPNGQVHQFSLSLGDYITQMISPASKTITYSYDSDKRLSTITKPSGKTLTYNYESGRNLLEDITTSSGTVLLSHDIRSRITSATSVDNIRTDITWASDQVQSQTWYDNGTVIASISNTFGTDVFNLKEVYLDNFLIASYSYYAGILNGISNLGITYSNSFSTYNHTQTVTGSGFSVTYQNIEGSSRTAKVVEGTYIDGSSNSIGVSMRRNFDYFGQATSLLSTKMNNNIGTYDSYYRLVPVYDSNDRLTQLTRYSKKYVGGVLTNFTDFVNKYTFPANSNNNVTGWRQTSGTTTTVTKQTSGTYNIDDQLTQMTGSVSRTYTYTQDGEVSTMVNASGTTTYSYDVFGNLNKAVLPGSITVEYKMDAFNRRVKKLVNGSVDEYYLWYDQTRLAVILDSSKNPKVIYVYGAESKKVPSFVIKSGVTYKIIHDPGTESVRYVIDASTGVIAQEIEYDEFGNMILNTDYTFQPLGYAGGMYDSHTKLVKFGARDYDPVIGRWISKDPIGFAGGDTNLYAYVGGDPMSYIDTDGHKKIKINNVTVNVNSNSVAAGVGAGAVCMGATKNPIASVVVGVAAAAVVSIYQGSSEEVLDGLSGYEIKAGVGVKP